MMEKIKGNELIAEFVCMRIDSLNGDTWAVGHTGKEIWHNVSEEDWQYHTSWDWLMPVVEKIQEQTGRITLSSTLDLLTNKGGKIICNQIDLWQAAVIWLNNKS